MPFIWRPASTGPAVGQPPSPPTSGSLISFVSMQGGCSPSAGASYSGEWAQGLGGRPRGKKGEFLLPWAPSITLGPGPLSHLRGAGSQQGQRGHGQCSGGCSGQKAHTLEVAGEMTSQNGTGIDGETSLIIRESHTAPSYTLLEPGGGD